MKDGQLLAEVGRDQHDGPSRVEVGDGRAGKAEHDLGGETVRELGVDVVRPEHALREARPHVRILIGPAGATDHRDGRRARGVERRPQAVGRGVERLGP